MAKTASKKSTSKNEKNDLTADVFIKILRTYRSDAELKKYERYFKFSASQPLKDDEFIGVRMGQVFNLAKEFIEMPVEEIETLMENRVHEIRAGGMSIMDKQARSKKTSPIQRKALFDLYLRRHDRVNSWDLVDLAAVHVVGGYLADKPRKVLYKLAKSKDPWERRTAILSTAYFIRQGELDDTYKISTLLLKDENEFVQKAAGWMLRFAGDKDRKLLFTFLDKHGLKMPRPMLRNAIEKLDKKQREHYLKR